MKSDIPLNITEKLQCPFCDDKIEEHSQKNLKRHFHKLYNSGIAMQQEIGRLQILLMAWKKLKGDVKDEDLAGACQEIQKEIKEEYEKKQNQLNVVSKVE